jgi:Protein of unknown function (DUF4054)
LNFPPQASDFQAYFTREFTYGSGKDSVTDADINRALGECNPFFNQSIWDNQTDAFNAYLYLAAHLMVMNLQQMAGGLSAVPRGKGVRNQAKGVAVAKGLGQANVTYMPVPERIASSATLLYFFQTTFGQRYIQMAGLRLIGNMAVVCGPGWFDQAANQ